MQAGLMRRRLTFREVFEMSIAFLASKERHLNLPRGSIRQSGCSTNESGRLATFNDGSTRRVSHGECARILRMVSRLIEAVKAQPGSTPRATA